MIKDVVGAEVAKISWLSFTHSLSTEAMLRGTQTDVDVDPKKENVLIPKQFLSVLTWKID